MNTYRWHLESVWRAKAVFSLTFASTFRIVDTRPRLWHQIGLYLAISRLDTCRRLRLDRLIRSPLRRLRFPKDILLVYIHRFNYRDVWWLFGGICVVHKVRLFSLFWSHWLLRLKDSALNDLRLFTLEVRKLLDLRSSLQNLVLSFLLEYYFRLDWFKWSIHVPLVYILILGPQLTWAWWTLLLFFKAWSRFRYHCSILLSYLTQKILGILRKTLIASFSHHHIAWCSLVTITKVFCIPDKDLTGIYDFFTRSWLRFWRKH